MTLVSSESHFIISRFCNMCNTIVLWVSSLSLLVIAPPVLLPLLVHVSLLSLPLPPFLLLIWDFPSQQVWGEGNIWADGRESKGVR